MGKSAEGRWSVGKSSGKIEMSQSGRIRQALLMATIWVNPPRAQSRAAGASGELPSMRTTACIASLPCRIAAELGWSGDRAMTDHAPGQKSHWRGKWPLFPVRDGLYLEELVQAEDTTLASVPGLLEPAKGRALREALAIALDHARTHAARDAAEFFLVACLNVIRQPVLGVIGHGDGVFLVLERQDRQDRPEDLLAVDRHLGRHVGEDRGPDVETAIELAGPPGAAGDKPRALVDAGLNQRLDLVELRLADRRADMAAFLVGGAHRHAFGRRDRLFDGLIVARAFHHHPARRVAALAGVAEAADDPGLHGLLGRVGEDDVGALATQLEADTLDCVGRRLGDQPSRAGRSGEAYHIEIRMRRQR